jgi:flavin reductase (DIM6/NTAB) family NADH-FMN oxidoreductase RutF
MGFKLIDTLSQEFNPFQKIGQEWFLITSGNPDNFNMMTASWGSVGELWGKHTFTAYIRNTRKTFELMESNDLFTISFFGSGCRDELAFCGSHSGRDCDKAAETGLKPVSIDGTVSFEQAKAIYVCRKLYSQFFNDENFIDKSLLKFYEKDDYHKLYVGEIIKTYEAE